MVDDDLPSKLMRIADGALEHADDEAAVRDGADQIVRLRLEGQGLRERLRNLVERCDAIGMWHDNWDLPFADDDEWIGDAKLWRDAIVRARAVTNGERSDG